MQKQDIAPIACLEKACFSTPWSEASLQEELNNPLAVFLVCRTREGQTVGYVGMHHVLDEGYIANVAVDAAYRRKGIAGKLFKALEEEAKRLKLAFISLEVRSQNAGAIAFYRSQGLTLQGFDASCYTNQDIPNHEVRMEFGCVV